MENEKLKLLVRVKLETKLKSKKFGLHPTHLMHHQRQLDIDINGYVPKYSEHQMLKM